MATNEYAERIRAARRFAGISQTKLANALGRDAQWIKRRERDEPKEGDPVVKDRDLVLIATATGAPIDYLRTGEAPEWFLRQAGEAVISGVPPTATSLDDRVAQLETTVDGLLKLVTERLALGAGEHAEDPDTREDREDDAEPGPGG